MFQSRGSRLQRVEQISSKKNCSWYVIFWAVTNAILPFKIYEEVIVGARPATFSTLLSKIVALSIWLLLLLLSSSLYSRCIFKQFGLVVLRINKRDVSVWAFASSIVVVNTTLPPLATAHSFKLFLISFGVGAIFFLSDSRDITRWPCTW